MLASISSTKIGKLVQQRNALTALIAGLFALNVIQGIVNISLSNGLGVKLVPSGFQEPIRLSKNSGDAAYLRELADYFSLMFLNTTPENKDSRIDMVLKYVHPSDYADMKAQMLFEAEEMQKFKQSRYFTPVYFEVDENSQTVYVVGDEVYLIGKKPVNTIRKKYKIQFAFIKGAPYLKEFSIVNEGNIL